MNEDLPAVIFIICAMFFAAGAIPIVLFVLAIRRSARQSRDLADFLRFDELEQERNLADQLRLLAELNAGQLDNENFQKAEQEKNQASIRRYEERGWVAPTLDSRERQARTSNWLIERHGLNAWLLATSFALNTAASIWAVLIVV